MISYRECAPSGNSDPEVFTSTTTPITFCVKLALHTATLHAKIAFHPPIATIYIYILLLFRVLDIKPYHKVVNVTLQSNAKNQNFKPHLWSSSVVVD